MQKNYMQGSNSQIAVGDKSKAAPWYSKEVRLTPEARRMLEDYSKVPPEEVKDHVLRMVQTLLITY